MFTLILFAPADSYPCSAAVYCHHRHHSMHILYALLRATLPLLMECSLMSFEFLSIFPTITSSIIQSKHYTLHVRSMYGMLAFAPFLWLLYKFTISWMSTPLNGIIHFVCVYSFFRSTPRHLGNILRDNDKAMHKRTAYWWHFTVCAALPKYAVDCLRISSSNKNVHTIRRRALTGNLIHSPHQCACNHRKIAIKLRLMAYPYMLACAAGSVTSAKIRRLCLQTDFGVNWYWDSSQAVPTWLPFARLFDVSALSNIYSWEI